jgi:hypothetical protein
MRFVFEAIMAVVMIVCWVIPALLFLAAVAYALGGAPGVFVVLLLFAGLFGKGGKGGGPSVTHHHFHYR